MWDCRARAALLLRAAPPHSSSSLMHCSRYLHCRTKLIIIRRFLTMLHLHEIIYGRFFGRLLNLFGLIVVLTWFVTIQIRHGCDVIVTISDQTCARCGTCENCSRRGPRRAPRGCGLRSAVWSAGRRSRPYRQLGRWENSSNPDWP